MATDRALHNPADLGAHTAGFYRSVMQALADCRVRFLIGGGFAMHRHTGLARATKDLDLFVLPGDIGWTLQALASCGFETELTFPHWLGKVRRDGDFVDLIFSSGNGLCPVDEQWFEHGKAGEMLGLSTFFTPVEEMIWQKAFIMERQRYDGADIAHLLHACGDSLDWPRLLMRFQDTWEVLLSHLILAGFVYPGQQCAAAKQATHMLAARLAAEQSNHQARIHSAPTCRGVLLSLFEYQMDVQTLGYRDARLPPTGVMTAAEIDHWTANVEQ